MEGLNTRDHKIQGSREDTQQRVTLRSVAVGVTSQRDLFGQFRPQLRKVSAPASEANLQGPQPKTAAQVTFAQKHNSHKQPTSDFGLMLLPVLPRDLEAAPASHQNPYICIKHQRAKPLLATGPILTSDPKVSESKQ